GAHARLGRMYHVPMLGLAEARAAVDAALAAAGQGEGTPVAVAVVDREGVLVAYAREDGATYLSRRMAIRKAYTSARLGADSGTYGSMLAGGGMSMADFGDPELTGFGGGVCV